MAHWLIKSEPYKYPFSKLLRDGVTTWDGVRNYEARNNLRAMKKGDLALYYHSNEGKEIVGIARVKTEAYPDATAKKDEGDWSVVDFEPVVGFTEPVTLAFIKQHTALSKMLLVKRARISVVPVTAAEFKAVLSAGKTKMP